MPLLKKKPFKRLQPPAGLELDDEVFYCEATKEVFKDYESFFQRMFMGIFLPYAFFWSGKTAANNKENIQDEHVSIKFLYSIHRS